VTDPITHGADDSTGSDAAPLHPLQSILILLIFGTTASVLVPEDVQAVGALRVSSFLLAVGLIAGPLWQSRHNPKLLLRAEHVLAYAPVFWLLLDPIQGAYPMPGFSADQIRITFVAIGVFSFGGWLGAFRPSAWLLKRLPMAVFDQFSANTYFGFGIVCFCLAFLRFAVPAEFDLSLMFNSLLENRWAAPWARGQTGGWDAFLDHLSYFGYILPLLTVLQARRSGWFHPRTVVTAICAILITLFLAQGGSRRIIGVVAGSAIVFWFLSLKKVRFGSIITFIALLVLIAVSLNSILEFRTKGLNETELELANVANDEDSLVFINVDDNFLRLSQITTIFPQQVNYTTWRYPLWVAVRPVPRVLWPSKPMDPGFDLAEFLGLPQVSLSSSVVGELFICGGLPAVLLGGFFYGRIAAAFSPLVSSRFGTNALLLYSASLLMLFAGFRSMLELVLMSYMLLVWIVLCSLRPARK